MKTSDQGIFALALHEGIVPGPYKDSVNVWTCGIGHTAAAGAPDPAKMPRGAMMDMDKVFAIFRKDLAQYEAAVERAVTVDLEQHEFDALVSFHFNTGAIGNAALVKKLNAGDRAGAAAGFMSWRKPPEIIERREAEQHLFATGEYPEGRVPIWGVSESGRVVWKQQASLGLDDVIGYLRGKPAQLLDAPLTANDRPTLRMGDRGAMVLDLQSQLKMIGQFPGKVDGVFGQLTFNAVTNVQSAANITMDGVVGAQTWAALRTADIAPERDVTADDLRKRGSGYVKLGDAQKTLAGMGGVSGVADMGTSALDIFDKYQGTAERLGAFVRDNWMVAAFVAFCAFYYFAGQWIIRERVRKAATGQDLSL